MLFDCRKSSLKKGKKGFVNKCNVSHVETKMLYSGSTRLTLARAAKDKDNPEQQSNEIIRNHW